MDQNSWSQHYIATSLSQLTLSTKCIKQSASFLLTMPEQAEAMSKLWLSSFQSAEEPARQLAMLYVVNEIILKCSSYGAPEVKFFFQDPLLEAIKFLRPGLLIRKVKKLVTMWADQKLFEPKYTHQLLRSIVNLDQKTGSLKDKSSEQEMAAIVKEFASEKLLEQLKSLKHLEEVLSSPELDLIPSCLNLPIDVVLNRVKNKEEGCSLSRQITTCSGQLGTAVKDLQRKLALQEEVFKLLEKAEVFYSVQQEEAAFVANAYKDYGQRVQKTFDALQGIESPPPGEILNSSGAKSDQDTVSPSVPADLNPLEFVDDDNDDDDDDVNTADASLLDDRVVVEKDSRPKAVAHAEDDVEPDPFGLRLTGKCKLLAVEKTGRPFDISIAVSFPFKDSILIDAQGDVDYRPMFAKMRENARLINESSKKPSSALVDFDGRTMKFSSTHRIRYGSGTKSPCAGEEDNMEMSDEEGNVDKQEAAGNVLKPLSVDSAPVGNQVGAPALTDTGDYDWRLAQSSVCKSPPAPVSDTVSLGSQDADLRFLPKESNKIEDVDQRQFVPEPSKPVMLPLASPSRTAASSTELSDWMSGGDRDLRCETRTTATENATSVVATDSDKDTDTRGLNTSFQNYPPPPPPLPLVDGMALLRGLLPPLSVSQAPSLLQQNPTVNLSHPLLSQYTLHDPPVVQTSMLSGTPFIGNTVSASSFISQLPSFAPNLAPMATLNLSGQAFARLSDSSITTTTTALVQPALVIGSQTSMPPTPQPMVSSSLSMHAEAVAPVSLQSQSNPLAALLKSIQVSNATAGAAVSEEPVERNSETSMTEDPFTIISRLTGLSNLIQSVRPSTAANASSIKNTSHQPHPNTAISVGISSPKYSATSSETSGSPRASVTASSPRMKRAHVTPDDLKLEVIDGSSNVEEDDGGATPTQDESDQFINLPVSSNGSSGYSFAGAASGIGVPQPSFLSDPIISNPFSLGMAMPPPPPPFNMMLNQPATAVVGPLNIAPLSWPQPPPSVVGFLPRGMSNFFPPAVGQPAHLAGPSTTHFPFSADSTPFSSPPPASSNQSTGNAGLRFQL